MGRVSRPTISRASSDPFFSTRPEGKGTGLGLSVSQSIAEAHGGSLTLGPSPTGRGVLARLDLLDPVE